MLVCVYVGPQVERGHGHGHGHVPACAYTCTCACACDARARARACAKRVDVGGDEVDVSLPGGSPLLYRSIEYRVARVSTESAKRERSGDEFRRPRRVLGIYKVEMQGCDYILRSAFE